MPISIICPGCHSRFSVSEKFAGKQGPCPKCKTIIDIPKAEVKIHASAEFAGTAAKDQAGRPVFKPIAREETKVKPQWVAAIGAGVLITIGAAWMIGRASQQEDGTAGVSSFVLGVGALLVSVPLVIGGYSVLRNDELEPYRGLELLIRATICGACYAGLWGVYLVLRSYRIIADDAGTEVWVFTAPPFLAAGGAVSYLSLDMEYGNGVLHYAFYLGATALLRVIMGLHPV
jgi:hypothetical protein